MAVVAEDFREAFGELLTAIDERNKLVLRDTVEWDEFLREIAGSVPFYSRHFASRQPNTLEDFPIVTRAMIAENPHDFLNERFSGDTLVWSTTSGTSGHPLAVARDSTSVYAMFYDTFARIWAALELPSIDAAAGRCLIAIVNDNPERPALDTINPALGMASVRRVILGRGEASDAEVMATLETLRPVLLCGRPRALLHLLGIGGARCSELGTSALFCSGDNLTPAYREQLATGFGARVANGYASQEGGLIAIEQPALPDVLAVDRNVRLEVLTSDNGLAAQGEGEFVLSSRGNWAMPIIRYRTGDHGILCTDDNGRGVIRRLHGRVSVHFVVGGRRFNPSILNTELEACAQQFRVAQAVDGSFEVAIIARDPASVTGIEDRIRATLFRQFGATEVLVKLADRIGEPGEKVQRYVVESPLKDSLH